MNSPAQIAARTAAETRLEAQRAMIEREHRIAQRKSDAFLDRLLRERNYFADSGKTVLQDAGSLIFEI